MSARTRKTLPPARGESVNILDLMIQPKQPTPQRNQHCPCGSGKKYKRCCGAIKQEEK